MHRPGCQESDRRYCSALLLQKNKKTKKKRKQPNSRWGIKKIFLSFWKLRPACLASTVGYFLSQHGLNVVAADVLQLYLNAESAGSAQRLAARPIADPPSDAGAGGEAGLGGAMLDETRQWSRSPTTSRHLKVNKVTFTYVFHPLFLYL